MFTELIFGQQFNFIDDEESTRGLYDRKHEVLFGMFHLGRHIYFLIPLLCDLLWQQIKQAAGGPKPKWSMLGYLSVRRTSNMLQRGLPKITVGEGDLAATSGRSERSIEDSRIKEDQASYGDIHGIQAR
jgi:hypothetical protein